MEEWKKISLILCIYGVLKEFRPSEPFVTKYLNNPPMNFTEEQISSSIYPVSIYSSMVLLIIVFLITDFLRYKPVIVLDSISGIIVFIMLITCRELFLIQILEVFYGLFVAAEIAYYTYIYAKVDKEHFQEVSSHTRGAYLVGRAVSGIVSQILIYNDFSYYSLNFFTLVGMILSLFWIFLLPPVSSSLYFNSAKDSELGNSELTVATESDKINALPHTKKSYKANIRRGFLLLWNDFKIAFTNTYIIKWAFWWALATCGYYQILAYVQLLWEEIIKEDTEYYTKLNGAVEAAYTILSAAGAFLFGKIPLNWAFYGEPVLFVCSISIGIIVLIMAQTVSIWIAYISYIVYTIIYNCMITIACSEVAKHVRPDSYGLIFGFTTFISLVLQTALTAIVINALNLSARKQFEVYSAYFCFLGIIFGIKSLIRLIKWYRGGLSSFL